MAIFTAFTGLGLELLGEGLNLISVYETELKESQEEQRLRELVNIVEDTKKKLWDIKKESKYNSAKKKEKLEEVLKKIVDNSENINIFYPQIMISLDHSLKYEFPDLAPRKIDEVINNIILFFDQIIRTSKRSEKT
jgi:uncharacterized protein YlzI (FlbEa/FlbD family)